MQQRADPPPHPEEGQPSSVLYNPLWFGLMNLCLCFSQTEIVLRISSPICIEALRTFNWKYVKRVKCKTREINVTQQLRNYYALKHRFTQAEALKLI